MNRKALAAAAVAGALPTVADAAAAVAALPLLERGAAVVVTFEYLNETQGAHRLQEVDDEGTPLTNDADGAKCGAMYLRKAAFGEAKPGEKFRVTIERVE